MDKVYLLIALLILFPIPSQAYLPHEVIYTQVLSVEFEKYKYQQQYKQEWFENYTIFEFTLFTQIINITNETVGIYRSCGYLTIAILKANIPYEYFNAHGFSCSWFDDFYDIQPGKTNYTTILMIAIQGNHTILPDGEYILYWGLHNSALDQLKVEYRNIPFSLTIYNGTVLNSYPIVTFAVPTTYTISLEPEEEIRQQYWKWFLLIPVIVAIYKFVTFKKPDNKFPYYVDKKQ